MIPDEKLQEVSEVLASGECGLLIVAIDRKAAEISPLLEQAQKATVVETRTGDMDAAFYGALGAATTTGHAALSALCRHARATGPMWAAALLADRSYAQALPRTSSPAPVDRSIRTLASIHVRGEAPMIRVEVRDPHL
jgi:hypothetical protein